jgi:putrescine aminotransferase
MLTCADDLERVIVEEAAETVAAVIVDPCSTASAVSIPPPGYLPRLRQICDQYGVLLIADEVITGFGRTGKMFACEHWGLIPDIMTVSKGLSSGYMPIGATIVKEEIAQVFLESPEGILSHGQTYGGHPVACAVALKNIELIEREGLAEQAAEKGVYLLEGLRSLSHHPTFGDVRGLGLLCGLEFVHDKATRRLPDNPRRAGYCMRTLCRDQGLITLTLHPGNVLFLAPPLTISHAEIDQMVSMIDRALSAYEDRYL